MNGVKGESAQLESAARAGETGLGILHCNVTSDGEPDEQSTHVDMPVEVRREMAREDPSLSLRLGPFAPLRENQAVPAAPAR